MHIFIVLLSLATFYSFSMENNQPLPILPLEILTNFETFKNKECITYKSMLGGYGEDCALPWTISPTYLKHCDTNTPMDADLTNPQPGDQVLPNAQLWTRNGTKFRLSEDSRRTNDTFTPFQRLNYDLCMFDGINKKNKAAFACKYNPGKPNASYELYIFTQSSEFGKETKSLLTLFSSGLGTLRSLMLENERNKIMYSIDNTGTFTLIREKLIKDENTVDKNTKITTQTEGLFIKTVCLGKNLYFGITAAGALHSIKVTDGNKLVCAEQNFSICPHTFIQICVDNMVTNKKGIHPKFALLTDKGEIYITHLDAYKKENTFLPILFYVTTIKNIADVKRLFYKDGQLSIIYKNGNEALVWQDNFELLYLCSLLKRMYHRSFE